MPAAAGMRRGIGQRRVRAAPERVGAVAEALFPSEWVRPSRRYFLAVFSSIPALAAAAANVAPVCLSFISLLTC